MDSLKSAIWNANGLYQRTQKLKIFLHSNKIDVILIAETCLTTKNYITIPYYNVYDTRHPSWKTRGDSAIIIKQEIKHFLHCSIAESQIQATAVTINTIRGNITLSAVYCSPNENISTHQYVNFFKVLGNRLIEGGHYNAKNTQWSSKTTSPRGKILHHAIRSLSLHTLSTGKPTY